MLDKRYQNHEKFIEKVLDAKSIVTDYSKEFNCIHYYVTYGEYIIRQVKLTYNDYELIKVDGCIMLHEIETLKIIE